MVIIMLGIGICWTLIAVAACGTTGKAHYFQQDLDHFESPGLDQVQVPQRFWVTDTYWDEQGPVFLYLCGETNCANTPSNWQYPLQVAEQLHALFISAEHRYYGKSLPGFPGNLQEELPSGLEVHQALTDTALLVSYLKDSMKLAGQRWVVIGGGYAGALAAWFRTQYPQLVDAAWASSATIQSISSFVNFDAQIYTSISASGQDCVQALQQVNQMATDAYQQGQWTTITDIFGVTGIFKNDADKRTVLWFLADAIAQLVITGHRSELCQTLTVGKPIISLTSIANLNQVKLHTEILSARCT